jgi:predicted DNA repair protein MutK
MCGGTYLAFEGAEKLHHRFFAHDPADDDEVSVAEAEQTFGPEHEERTIAGAIRTDLILSAEIMVISLKEVLDEGIVSRAIILAIVAVVITVIVYGVVALIVKMDDAGLRLVERGGATSARLGRGLVTSMPKVLATLSSVGTVAMLWVGGHILVVGTAELGWEGPEHLVHSLEHGVDDVAGVGGVLGWCVNTLASAIVGLVVGVVVVAVATAIRGRRGAAPAH